MWFNPPLALNIESLNNLNTCSKSNPQSRPRYPDRLNWPLWTRCWPRSDNRTSRSASTRRCRVDCLLIRRPARPLTCTCLCVGGVLSCQGLCCWVVVGRGMLVYIHIATGLEMHIFIYHFASCGTMKRVPVTIADDPKPAKGRGVVWAASCRAWAVYIPASLFLCFGSSAGNPPHLTISNSDNWS